MPEGLPTAFQEEFSSARETEWRAFLVRGHLGEGTRLTDVLSRLAEFIEPVLEETRRLSS